LVREKHTGEKLAPTCENSSIKQQLYELYWDNGLSLRQIAKELGVAKPTIRAWMIKHKIPRRSQVRDLSITPDENLAYVFGVLCGDGCLCLRKKIKKYYISLKCKDRDFIETFVVRLSKVLKRDVRYRWYHKVGQYIVEAYVPRVSTSLFTRYPTGTMNWRIPDFIKHDNGSLATEYLKGLFDSEGSVYSKNRTKKVVLSSFNHVGLYETKKLLEKLGFTRVKVSIKGNNLALNNYPDLKLFYEKIGFSIQRQQKKLRELLGSYKRLPLRYRFSADQLHILYWDRRISLPEIARRYRVSTSGIHKLMQHYDIPRRAPGFH
jgi:intein-encoded DNA endonuclease-like protein